MYAAKIFVRRGLEVNVMKNTISKISKIEKKAIREFKSQLSQKLGKDIISIQLFGSRARGNSGKNSDIDILVVLKKPTEEQINYIYDVAMRLTVQYGVYLSVKIFSQKEFNYYKSIPTLFIRNVLREGVSI